MVYFLKKSNPSKKGTYLQIYLNYYDPNTKSKKNKSYKALGYVSDLIDKGINDPISYYTEYVKKLNDTVMKAIAGWGYNPEQEKRRFSKSKK